MARRFILQPPQPLPAQISAIPGGNGLYLPAANSMGLVTGSVEFLRLSSAGLFSIGTPFTNANMTMGLTINQGGNDDEIIAVKSSDIDHGMTSLAETDTYGTLRKAQATAGGLEIRGFSEATASIALRANGTTDNTAKSTAADGYLRLSGARKNATTEQDPGVDANILVIQLGATGTTRHIFDTEGTYHGDEPTAIFDDYDDLAALDAQHALANPAIPGAMAQERVALLERMGIFGKGSYRIEGGRPRAMVNNTRHRQLLHSGLRLAWHETRGNTEAIERLESRVAALEGVA